MLTADRPVPFVQQAQLSLAAPQVTSLLTNGTAAIVVTFDQAVTWLGTSGSSLEVAGFTGDVDTQLAPNQVRWLDAGSNPHVAAEPWIWTTADPTLAPVPNPAQTGVTI